MAKRRGKNRAYSRDAPKARSAGTQVALTNPDAWKILCGDGYKPITACPEVQMAVGVYADMIASMTIHLMQNTDQGDVRIRDGLSRRMDIEPNAYMTRYQFIYNLVHVMMLEGDGNQITLPVYRDGLLESLEPVRPSMVSILPPQNGSAYRVMIGGAAYAPDEVLHFVLNPDPEAPYRGRGYSVALRDVVKSLRQTNATKTALLESPTPSLIVKVEGLDEQLQSAEGRREFAKQYLNETENGRPWFIPAEALTVQEVRPMTLADLAIKDGLELDKRSIAALLGVPAFLLGVGQFDAKEFDWFVSVRLMGVARIIEQELTRKTLIAPDRYWRFNSRSLLAYDVERISKIAQAMVDRMALRRNEWRDWIGFAPDPEMNDLLILENYLRKNKDEDALNDQTQESGEEAGGESNA